MKRIVERQLLFNLFQTSVLKKTLVSFVFLCMMVNGFTPRSEEGRNSLVIVMACAMQNAVSEVFVSCNEALTEISNKVTKSLYAMLLSKDVSTTSPVSKEKDESPQPVNTTSDSGIMIEKRVETKAGYNRIESNNEYISFIMTSKLYKLYENIKLNCKDRGLGVLLFILFAVYIVRRKEISENIIKSGYKRSVLVS